MGRSSKKILVVYHASCPDGFGAAWAAWKKFGARAEYRAMSHAEPPRMEKGREIYFLDFTHKPDVMRRLAKSNRVTVIDHHVSARESAEAAHEKVYDLRHSGAVLSFKYFHPGRPVPRLLLHIEDEDLWKFKLPGTNDVTARLELLRFDLKELDAAVRAFEKPATRKKFLAEGRLLSAYRGRTIARIVEENAVPVNFLGYHILAVNGARPFTSEIGNRLCKMKPPIGIMWQERPDGISVSMRSDGSVDVSKIAARFGGGGHKEAAAFHLPHGSKHPWKVEKRK